MIKTKSRIRIRATSSPFIKLKSSKIHRHGLFASKAVPIYTKLIEYVGDKISKMESDRRSDLTLEKASKGDHGHVYIFELNSRWDLDGDVHWNTAGMINHSCDPNCESVIDDGKIWITSIRPLKKGEEVTYDYGYDLECWEEHPCLCGSENCLGYIVSSEHGKKLEKILLKRAAKKRRN